MRRKVAALMGAPLLLVVACGGSAENAAGSTPTDGNDAVTVGVLPTVDVAPIYLGMDKGLFAGQGIDLTLETDRGGAAVVPGVVNGAYDFGFSNVVSLLLAAQEHLPLKIVANGAASSGKEGADYSAVVADPDSGITDAADLEGKRVAVNTPNNIGTTTINQSVRRAGGDPSSIDYVKVPFPDMPEALAQGDVDAIWVVEPFLTVATAAGGTVVASNFVDTADALTVGTYFTNKKLAAEDPDLVERFTTAIDESLEYATAHPDEARAVVAEYADRDVPATATDVPSTATPATESPAAESTAPEGPVIDQAVTDAMTLPTWPTEINRTSVRRLAELALDDRLLDVQPDLDALLP